MDGKVVICGGAGVDIYSECFSLKIGDTKWMPVGQMEFRRRYPESVVFNGEMYIMGGYNTNQGWLNSIEKLNGGLMANWNMPRPIFDFCAVQMDDKRIMVLGRVALKITHFECLAGLTLKLSLKSKSVESICPR